ncbi:MAG: ATP-binding protein [Nitrospirales bacterium]
MTTDLVPVRTVEPHQDVAGESIFHKMRNILNSVHVSTGVLHQQLRDFHLEDFGRVADMLDAHSTNLGWYLSQDPKGKKIPTFLGRLSQGLLEKHLLTINELHALQTNLEQLECLLAAGQGSSRAGGFKDMAKFPVLLDDVLSLHQEELNRLGVQVTRKYQPVQDGILEVSKLQPILLNIIRTAINAMRDAPGRPHCLSVHILNCPDREKFVRVQVVDTGVGIPMAMLTQVVSLPTSTTTHGSFLPNLYASAMGAKELGGALRVWSEGEQQGTSLTLDLPVIYMEGNR